MFHFKEYIIIRKITKKNNENWFYILKPISNYLFMKKHTEFSLLFYFFIKNDKDLKYKNLKINPYKKLKIRGL
jgi:hypothetical protein